MGSLRLYRGNEFLRQLLAAGCIALVLALGLFAASPVLHDQLHQNIPPSPDDGCAIVLFANGVSVPLAAIAAPPAPAEWRAQVYPVAAELLLESPRYRLQPGRGPPAA